MNRGAWWSHKDLDKTEQLTLSKDRGRQAVLTLTHTHTDTQTHTHTHTHTHTRSQEMPSFCPQEESNHNCVHTLGCCFHVSI